MEKTVLKKRLIGSEDINWDTTGEDQYENFTNSAGNKVQLKKINARDVPLTKKTSEKTGFSNVDDCLEKLQTQIDIIDAAKDFLSADRTIVFPDSYIDDDMQNVIDQEAYNLNGYSLTFEFAEALNQIFSHSLVWKNFFTGALIIDGKGITVSDSANFGSLFEFTDCTCKVLVRNFTFRHSHCPYAVKAVRCTGISFENCIFIGGGTGFAGVNFIQSNGDFLNCSFTNDAEYTMSGIAAEALQEVKTALNGKANSSHTHTIANITNLQATLNGKANSSHTHTIANITNLQATLDSLAGTGSQASAGYTKLPNGIIIQWGKSAASGSAQSFPIAFPSACVAITQSGTTAWNRGQSFNIVSRSQFSITAEAYSATYWIAIGY